MKKSVLPLGIALIALIALGVTACAPPPAAPLRPRPDAFSSSDRASLPEAAIPQGAAPDRTPLVKGQPFGRRADVRAFISEMATQHRLDPARLQAVFDRAYPKPEIITAMDRPAEGKPWYAYRELFLNTARIQGGVQFWRANRTALARAQRTFGVPPEIVVAIIGVETQYGGNMGKYRVLEALSTLAFGYPRRAAYFRKELANFLVLTHQEGLDPLTPRGSYAGAMGYGQFMPSSFLSYAVDFDGDGHRNLWRNPTDAVGSVAHYFVKHGWRTGESVIVPARVQGPVGEWVSRKLTPPQHSLARLQAQGITPQGAVVGARTALLLEYQGRQGPEYWLGFDNFYAITRYNHSQSYALAIYQLAQAIRQRYQL